MAYQILNYCLFQKELSTFNTTLKLNIMKVIPWSEKTIFVITWEAHVDLILLSLWILLRFDLYVLNDIQVIRMQISQEGCKCTALVCIIGLFQLEELKLVHTEKSSLTGKHKIVYKWKERAIEKQRISGKDLCTQHC